MNPAKSLFPGQQPSERIHLVTRPHWIILARRVLMWFVFVALLLLLDVFVTSAFPAVLREPYIYIFNLIKTLYLMLLTIGIFSIWIIYYLNYQIVTNERVVDITQEHLLSHTTVEFHLNRVQDVTAEIKGVLGNVFNFGDVFVETAGENTRFEFNNVPDPHRVAKLILDLYEQLPPDRRDLGRV